MFVALMLSSSTKWLKVENLTIGIGERVGLARQGFGREDKS